MPEDKLYSKNKKVPSTTILYKKYGMARYFHIGINIGTTKIENLKKKAISLEG
jgi:hypothetical protein